MRTAPTTTSLELTPPADCASPSRRSPTATDRRAGKPGCPSTRWRPTLSPHSRPPGTSIDGRSSPGLRHRPRWQRSTAWRTPARAPDRATARRMKPEGRRRSIRRADWHEARGSATSSLHRTTVQPGSRRIHRARQGHSARDLRYRMWRGTARTLRRSTRRCLRPSIRRWPNTPPGQRCRRASWLAHARGTCWRTSDR